jgi:hypothetical protein
MLDSANTLHVEMVFSDQAWLLGYQQTIVVFGKHGSQPL